MLSGVRGAGLTGMNQQIQFNLSSAGMQAEEDRYQQKRKDDQKAARAALYGQILSSGIGAIGNVYGMNQLSGALKAGGGDVYNV